MGYKTGNWYLHKTIGVRGKPIYFFTKNEKWRGKASINMPAGYKLGGRNKKTGMPYIKKK